MTPSKYLCAVYLFALALSVSLWLIALHTPLWLDETVSYWQIHGGFGQLWSRAFLFFPAYNFVLWMSTKFLGTSEIALRVPSIIAMLGAVYLLYQAAKELLGQELALLTIVLFSANPIVIFAAIDARPYAFAVLAIVATIYCLARLRTNDSSYLAAAFGLSAALIIWFQFLYGVILPVLVMGFFVVKRKTEKRVIWRQLGVATVSFVIALVPVLRKILEMLRSPGSHSFSEPAKSVDLIWTIAPGWQLLIFLGTAFIALMIAAWKTKIRDEAGKGSPNGWAVAFCATLALVPLLLLYEVSVRTSLHIFVQRYRLVAIPGVALGWAAVVGLLKPRVLRPLFCLAVVATVAQQYWTSPIARHHGYTWKYAIDVAEANARADNATVLMCSDLPEADFTVMPADDRVKDSMLFAPLSYYQLSVPVVAMPRTLNNEAIRIGSAFLQKETQQHQRFLAMGFMASYPTLDWLAKNAASNYEVHELGSFDEVKVLELTPRK